MLGIHHSIFFVSIPLPLHPTIILPPQRTGNLSIFKLSRLSFISTSLPPSCDPLAVVVVIVAVYVVAAAIEISSRLHEQIRGTLFVIEGSHSIGNASFGALARLCWFAIQL